MLLLGETSESVLMRHLVICFVGWACGGKPGQVWPWLAGPCLVGWLVGWLCIGLLVWFGLQHLGEATESDEMKLLVLVEASVLILLKHLSEVIG